MANIMAITYEVPYPLSHGMALHVSSLFSGIAKEHRVVLLFPVHEGWEGRAAELKGIFSEMISFEMSGERGSLPGRLLNIAAGMPSFFLPLRNRRTFIRIRSFIEEILKREAIELIHCNSLKMSQFFLDLHSVPKLLDMEDCQSLRIKREILNGGGRVSKRLEFFRVRRYERKAVQAFDLCTTVSEADSREVRSLKTSTPVATVPNGVDLDFFKPSGVREGRVPTVIFFGNLRFPPNTDAALFLVQEVMPRVRKESPEVRCLIAGKDPPPILFPLQKDPRNVLTGFLPDLRPSIEESHVAAMPLRTGSGIKNKVIEAMALEKPVVAFPLGVEALEVEEGRHFLLARDAGEMAQKIILLLKDEELRGRLGREGRRRMEERYTWDRSVGRYLELYRGLMERRSSSPHGGVHAGKSISFSLH